MHIYFFTHFIYPGNSPARYVGTYRRGNIIPERLSAWPKVTQLKGGAAKCVCVCETF